MERFLTAEQRKQQEEESKREEERRLQEKADNWRERGLDQMMGGVLEIKKEDELKKVMTDFPVYNALAKVAYRLKCLIYISYKC